MFPHVFFKFPRLRRGIVEGINSSEAIVRACSLRALRSAAPLKRLASLPKRRKVFSMTISVNLPESLARAVLVQGEQSDQGVFVALVFYAYARGRLSAGKASETLGVNREEFDRMRVERGIEIPFTTEELDADLAWARSIR